MSDPFTLYLPVKQPWFGLMLSGEKPNEYRSPSKWIISRLFWQLSPLLPKKYNKVRFINGYGAHRPWFEIEFLGARKAVLNQTIYYSTGDKLELYAEFYVIRLGKVLASGNLELLKTKKQPCTT